MSADSIIARVGDALRATPNILIHHDPEPSGPTSGVFAEPLDSMLHPLLANLLSGQYPKGLFRHQSVAIGQVVNGSNTVVATQTSSGKSLIFNVPVLDSLLRDSNATALFLYPQKALANDQFAKLIATAQQLAPLAELLKLKPFLISRYDGSTAQGIRSDVRNQVQIALTNPDMLHIGILQHHEKNWGRFFENLRYAIIDECHEYRGIFGTNVAYIIRRLRQICDIHGSSPTFIATSATIREPREHLEKLTGLPFTEVGSDVDGSAQGRKKFWLVSSQDHFYDLGRKLALDFAKRGLSVLAFCPSRIAAERMLSRIKSSHDDELPCNRSRAR